MALSERLTRAQEILGHEFNNKVLLRAALTHPSAVEGQPVSASYERLEFLGDSILGAVVARSLFESYPEFDEGKLTRLKVSLVSGATLSRCRTSWVSTTSSSLVPPRPVPARVACTRRSRTSMSRSWARCIWMLAGMRRRSLSTVRLSPIWPLSVPSILRTPSRSCRSACRQTAMSLPRISSLAPGPGACAHLYRRGIDRWYSPGSRLRLLKEGSRGSRCTRGT